MDVEKLKQLKQLLDSGVLTQQEFEAEKAKVLAGNDEAVPVSKAESKPEKTAKNELPKDTSKRNILLIVSCVLLLFAVFTCGKFFSGLFLFILLIGHGVGLVFSGVKDQKFFVAICILAIFVYFLLGLLFEYRGTGVIVPIIVGILDVINYLRISKLINSGFIDKEDDDDVRRTAPVHNYVPPTPAPSQGVVVNVNTGGQSPAPAQNVPTIDKYDLLQRLKAVYDSEALSKYEYEHEKYQIEYHFDEYSSQDVYNISVRYNQLLKIKQLYDSGAMRKYEYDSERYKLLHD